MGHEIEFITDILVEVKIYFMYIIIRHAPSHLGCVLFTVAKPL